MSNEYNEAWSGSNQAVNAEDAFKRAPCWSYFSAFFWAAVGIACLPLFGLGFFLFAGPDSTNIPVTIMGTSFIIFPFVSILSAVILVSLLVWSHCLRRSFSKKVALGFTILPAANILVFLLGYFILYIQDILS